MTRDDVEGLLGIPIRRISLVDLEKNRKEIERLRGELAEVEQDLDALVPYAIRYLRGLLRKYGDQYPRRTQLAEFGEISERELTANELTIAYDREKGYIGHKVAGDAAAVLLAAGQAPAGLERRPLQSDRPPRRSCLSIRR